MLNGTRSHNPFARAKLVILLVSLQLLACGSDAMPTDASSSAPSSQGSATNASSAGSTAASSDSSATPAGKSVATATAGSSASAPAATSGKSTAGGTPGSASDQPASGASAGATAPAAGSGASSSAPKGDVSTEMAGAGAGGAGAAGSSEAQAGSTGSAAGSGGETGAPAQDYGKGDGKDVVTIGDSWMNIASNGGGIEGGLDRAGTMYRHYAVLGTTLLSGQIPGQYDQAKAVNPDIKTLIMTGGGNDVMFSGGCNTKEACTNFSQMIADALDELWMRAEKDGVTGAVYVQYSRNAGTAPADTRPDNPAVPKICSNGKFRCVFIGTTDLIGPTDTVDGIHPTFDGCDRIAKRVLEEMEKAGLRR